MKKNYALFVILFSILLTRHQSSVAGTQLTPDQEKQAATLRKNSGPITTTSVLTAGTDVIIKTAGEDQTDVKVATAYNGWIYSAFITRQGSSDGINVSLSKDHGLTWNTVITEPGTFYSLDLIVCGNDTNLFDVYLASITYDEGTSMHTFWVNKYNGLTGTSNGTLISEASTDTIYNVALAHDFQHPSTHSFPYGIEAICSRHGASEDSVIAFLSTDGGANFTDRKIVDITTDQFGKVSVCYGYSPDDNAGKFFVAYEQHVAGEKYGHIKVSRTDSQVNDAFTTPIYVDSLYTLGIADWANLGSDPSISVQNSTGANSSNGLSAVVFWESKFRGTADIDNVCAFSLMAGSSSVAWTYGYVDYSIYHSYQADVCYDDVNDKFLVTYWDSTFNKLKYYSKSFNMPLPTAWDSVISNYNDGVGTLLAAYPQISFDPFYQTANFVWSEIRGGDITALFDAEFSLTGIQNPNGKQSASFRNYPNPTSDLVNFSFSLDKTQPVMLELFDVVGKKISVIENEVMSAGSHNVKFDVSKLPAGFYTVRYKTELELNTNKLQIVH